MIEIDTSLFPDQPNEKTGAIDPSIFPDRVSELEKAYRQTLEVDPVHAAKVIDYSQRLNQTPAMIDKNLPMAEKVANAPSSQYWDDFEKKNPGSTQYLLKNPEVIPVAKDDFDNMGAFEKYIKQASSGIVTGNLRGRDAELWSARLSESRRTRKASTKYTSELAKLEEELKPYEAIEAREKDASGNAHFHPLYQAAQQIPNMSRAILRVGAGENWDEMMGPAGPTGAAGTAIGAVAGAAIGSLAGGVGAAPGALAGAKKGLFWGSLSGLAAQAYQMEGGGAFKEYSALKDKAGNPIDQGIAADAAHTVGMINAALETGSDFILAKAGAPLAKGAGSLAVGGAMKVLKKTGIPGAEKLGSYIISNPKLFEGLTLGKAVKQAAKGMILAQVSELPTEYVQEVGTGGFGEVAKSLSGGEFETKTVGKILGDATGVLSPTAQSVMLMGVAGGGAHVAISARQIQQSNQAKQVYEALGEKAGQSKLRERLPEKFKGMVAEITKGTPVENIYISPEAAETYFQSKGIDSNAAVKELGIEKQFAEAKSTGLDIKIPLSVWTSKVVGTEHYNGLANDIKFDPAKLSVNEHKANEAQRQKGFEDVQKQADEAVAKDKELAPIREQIENDYRAKAIKARPESFTQKQWKQQVDTTSKLWGSLALITGPLQQMTPEQWHENNVPKIYNEKQAANIQAIPYKKDVILRIKDEISHGEHTSGGFIPADQQALTNDGKLIPSTSSFPEYFRDKGFTKDETLKAIENVLAGKDVTPRHAQIVSDLYKNSGYDTDFQKSEPFLQTSAQKQIAPEFYSRLEKTVQDKMGGSASVEQIKGMLREIKPEEMKYSGIDEFLAGKEKVSKQEVLDFLKENQIQVKEVKKGAGEGRDAAAMEEFGKPYAELNAKGKEMIDATLKDGGSTKFSQYTLPGGENYREVLFTLPELKDHNTAAEIAKLEQEYKTLSSKINSATKQLIAEGTPWDQAKSTGIDRGMFTADEANRLTDISNQYSNRKTRAQIAIEAGNYKSGHWDEQNVLAHVRLNDRVDSEGKKVLFVEEIQSDWHQAGRKQGYKGQEATNLQVDTERAHAEHNKAFENVKNVLKENGFPVKALNVAALRNVHKEGITERTAQDLAAAYSNEKIKAAVEKEFKAHEAHLNATKAEKLIRDQVPDAPFKKTWHEFALKKIIRMASEQGYDRIAWTTGEQQADRYSLNKHLKEVQYSPERETLKTFDHGGKFQSVHVTEDKLSDYVGLETAAKLVAAKENDLGYKVLSGLELKVGGEGMKGFYDKIVPDFLAKYTKKWGGKVGEIDLSTPDSRSNRGPKSAEKFPSSQKVHSLDVTPQMREAALYEGQTLFQDSGDKLGSVTFTQDGPVATMFNKANHSTLIHESSHIWLKSMHDHAMSGKADAKFMERYKTLSDWLDIKADQTSLTTPQQEKFARTFEAYLLEGKSPSEGLRKVFSQFKRWLINIYKSHKGLEKEAGFKIEISPEVRSFMDRMVASEEEIAAAEIASSEKIAEVKSPGIQELRDQAHDSAVSELLKLQMAELSKENKEKIAKEEKAIREKWAPVAAEMPIYKAQRELNENLNASKDAKDSKEIAKQYVDEKLNEENTLKFELIAEQNGYTSGDHLAQEILSYSNRGEQAFIEDKVESGMIAFHDLMDTSAIKDEAMRIIHSEKRLELIALEKQTLDDKIKGLPDDEAARKRRVERSRIDWQAAKAEAQKILANKPIGEATNFLPYFTAEKNSAMAVGRALEAKDLPAAASHKRRQLLNHALAMEALRLKKVVDKWNNYLESVQDKKKDLFKREEHFNQVAMILERFGYARDDFNPELRRESLPEWVNRMNEDLGNVAVSDWIMDETKRFDPKDMTVDQFQDLVNSVKNILSVANMENRALKILNGETIDEIVFNAATQIEKVIPEGDKLKYTAEDEKLASLWKGYRQYNSSLKKISTILRRADGWKEDGLFQKMFVDSVYEAATKESKLGRDILKKYEDTWSVYTPKERAAIFDKKIFIKQLDASAAKQRIISMALNLGNEGNRDRLFSTAPVWAKPGVEWNQAVVMQILSEHMTKKDWQFVQNTWDVINELWPETAELHKRMTGFTPEKVQAMPFIAKAIGGEEIQMKGGYYPLKADPRGSEKASIREQLDQPLYDEQNPAWMGTTKTGHTKARAKKFEYAVALDLSIPFRHMRDVIHDIAFREIVTDFRRLMANETFAATLKRNLGEAEFQELKVWTKSVATGRSSDRVVDFTEKLAQWLKSHSTTAMLALKPAVLNQNLANPLLFGSAVDGFNKEDAAHAYFVRGVGDYIPKVLYDRKGAEEIRSFVFEKSSFMADKHEAPDFSLETGTNNIMGDKSAVNEFAKGLMAGSDELTTIPMWLEAYHKMIDAGKTEKEAVRFADKLIERTTGSPWKYDQAGYARMSVLYQMFTMFFSFSNTEYNQWVAQFGKTKAGLQSNARLMGFVASRVLFFVTLSAILSGKGPGDKEDPWAWYFSQMLKSTTAFFPGVREVSSLMIDKALGLKTYGFRPSPVLGAVETVGNVYDLALSKAKGKAKTQDVAEAAAKSAALIFPYPDQINAWIFNGLDLATGTMKEPRVTDLYRRRPKKER